MRVVGNKAYVTANSDSALTVVDISNPAAPVFVGSIQGAGPPNFLGGAVDLQVLGILAFITAPDDDALTIIDVTIGPVLPTVASDPVTGLGIAQATLHGTLTNDGGEGCDCGFQWGKSVAYGGTTPTQSKTTGQTFSQIIAPLEPGTEYHYRAFARNSVGTAYGADVSIRTYPAPARGYSLGRSEL